MKALIFDLDGALVGHARGCARGETCTGSIPGVPHKRLGASAQECYAVGDTVWDLLAARRAGMLGIALLWGRYSEEELTKAGAYRVFKNPADLHVHLGELGLPL